MIGKPCIIRSKFAGVFAGTLLSRDGDEVTVQSCRRLWYWSGASSCSELANLGVSRPDKCRFPAPTPEQVVLGVVEIIPMSDAAVVSIAGVKPWTQH